MLSKLRIGPKLLLAPCAVLFLLIVVSCGAYYAMVRQNDSLGTIVEQRAVRLRDAAALVHSAQRAHTDVYQLLTWLGASFAEKRLAELLAVIDRDQADTGLRLRRLARDTAAGGVRGAELRMVEQAASAHAVYLKAVADVIDLARADASTSASAMSKAERAFDTVAARLAELSAYEQQLSEQAARRAAGDFATMSTLMPLAVLLSIALSLAITMAVRRALLREVTDIGDAAIDLASGNLLVPQRDYGVDEISATSRVLDTSIRNLNATLKGILASARSIDSASRQMAIGNADLSHRTLAQAHALLHTASSVEEIGAVLSRTASSAQAAARLTVDATSVASRGSDVVDHLLGTMGTIRHGARQASALADRIDGIASQAGMLALNAAVAAGSVERDASTFAAVALEVRMLVQQSAQSAREIGELMRHAVADIDGGSASASEAGDSIAHMARQVGQVGDIIKSISHASVEQASGILEVSEAIVQMDQMTQQNSSLVTEAARAAADLQRQAVGLAKAVAGFNLDEAALLSLPPRGADGSGRKAHLRLASSRL
ncbi:methyl-accepting chemotaxis protein [Massilia sp. DWR3-1-1]|uniref:methyl-accepting chemotaxis protein n=1 Tax=Massilia sp. DWR3-1-1 TaxID=2804559 RepID=UPI003CF39827